MSPCQSFRRHAFTLVELLISLTLMALLATAITASTRALTSTRSRVDDRIQALAAARQAIQAVVAELRNVRRDPDTDHPPVVGRAGDAGNTMLDLQVISDLPARLDSPESDQYEVGFTVWQREDGVPILLCRRNNALTPNPGRGGIAVVVAEGIIGLSCQFYSQGQWQNEWPQTELGIPEAVRVTVAATGLTTHKTPIAPVTLSTIVPIHVQPPIDSAQAASAQPEAARQDDAHPATDEQGGPQ